LKQDPINFMELRSEGEKSGHLPSTDPLGDLLEAAENADFQGVAQGTLLLYDSQA